MKAVLKTCQMCGGTGRVTVRECASNNSLEPKRWFEYEKSCPVCHGNGKALDFVEDEK